jgi:hypothetical protein
MPIIPATQDKGRSIEASPGNGSYETLSQKEKKRKRKRAGIVALVVECLLSMCKTLGFDLQNCKINK